MQTDEFTITKHVTELENTPIRWPEPDGEQILMCVVTEIEAFAELDPKIANNIEEPYINGMLHRGVPYRPRAWFGSISIAQAKAFSRATMRLERDGFVVRVTEPLRNRVSHVRPTQAGIRYVTDECRARADCIAAGLRRTKWGRPLADVLFDTMNSAGPIV